MKKSYIFLIAAFFTTSFSHGQTWSGATPGNIYYKLGNVGIGNDGPADILDVQNNQNATTNFYFRNTDATNTNSRAYLNLISGGNSLTLRSINSDNNYLSFSSGYFGIQYQSNIPSLTVLSSGSVGIGTISPGYKLDVQNGNASIYYNGIGTTFKVGGEVGKTQIALSTSADADGYGIIQSTSLAGISYGNTAINPNGGNVGIGTTSPDEKLTVNGTVHATEVKITSTVPYPDYVFKSNYSLPKLNAVKRYIDKNHHLPNVPTEAEVARNGLNVGQSETMLLKKVEELTLYLIEKDNQLSRQQNQIDLLNKKLNKLAKRQTLAKK